MAESGRRSGERRASGERRTTGARRSSGVRRRSGEGRASGERKISGERISSGKNRKPQGFERNKVILTLIVVGVIALAIYLISTLAGGSSLNRVTAAGASYLKSLETRDTAEIEAELREVRAARRREESESRKQELLDGTIDVWSLFGESVIMGDSRAVGFYTYEFLPQARTLAGGGDTIRLIETHMDELISLNPESLFLCYGLNDVSIGYWTTKEEYVAEYREILATLSESLPNTDIYVNSILPAQAVAISLEGSWANIPEYSAAVHEMVVEEGYGWVDCDGIAQEHVDLYDVDGIHMQREFYPYWAVQMMTAVYDSALEAEDTEE